LKPLKLRVFLRVFSVFFLLLLFVSFFALSLLLLLMLFVLKFWCFSLLVAHLDLWNLTAVEREKERKTTLVRAVVCVIVWFCGVGLSWFVINFFEVSALVCGFCVRVRGMQYREEEEKKEPSLATIVRVRIIIMGNSASSSNPAALTREEQDLKYLGERFAFGNAELWHLYHAHCAIISIPHPHHPAVDKTATTATTTTTSTSSSSSSSDNNSENISFLTDWAIQSTLILEQQERIRQQNEQQQHQLQRQLQQQKQQQQQRDYNRRRGVGGVGGGGGGGMVRNDQQLDEQEPEDDNGNNRQFFLARMSDDDFQNSHLPALQQERRASLQLVEQRILPIDLGNRLYRAACVVPGDGAAVNLYDYDRNDPVAATVAATGESSSSSDGTVSSMNQPVKSSSAEKSAPHLVDEYTRRARLTQLFEGFSNMGRRGAKATLQVMFQACRHQKQRQKRRNNNTVDYSYGSTSSSSAASSTTVTVVSALEMVDMGYRMALAAEYLQQRHERFHHSLLDKSTGSKSPAEDQGENGNNNTADMSADNNNNKKADEQEDDDENDDIMGMDVASLLPPRPSHWSLDDVSLSSTTRSSSAGAHSKGMLNSSLRALARSMIEKGKRRQERTDHGGGDGGIMFDCSPHQGGDNEVDYPKNNDDGDNDSDYDDDDGFVQLDDIVEWTEEVAPLFASTLPTLLHRILFPGKPYPPQQTPFSYPRILQESSFFVGSSSSATTKKCSKSDDDDAAAADTDSPVVVHANASPLLFGLACFSSSLSGLYFRLYTSASDGLSFNRLQNALLGYGGPTCIIIRAVADEHDAADHYNEGGIFGAVSASPWKESKDFYGTSDCFLFQLSPITTVYRPTSVARSIGDSRKNTHNQNTAAATGGKIKSSGPNYMYCNPHARSKGYDGQAHGIGFGGTVDQPRLFLDETFEQCYAGSQDWTFENGALLPPSNNRRKQYFQVDSLEVWGVGGTALVEKALDARQLVRDVRQEGIRRARKVDKAQFLDDFRSGLMDSKALAHREQIDGRAEQDCNERQAQAFDQDE
jgi:TLD